VCQKKDKAQKRPGTGARRPSENCRAQSGNRDLPTRSPQLTRKQSFIRHQAREHFVTDTQFGSQRLVSEYTRPYAVKTGAIEAATAFASGGCSRLRRTREFAERGSSFVVEASQQIDLLSPSGGEKAGREAHRKNGCDQAEGPGIACRNAPEFAGEQTSCQDGSSLSEGSSRGFAVSLTIHPSCS